MGSYFQAHKGKQMTGNSSPGFSKDELCLINLIVLYNKRTSSTGNGKALGVKLTFAKLVTWSHSRELGQLNFKTDEKSIGLPDLNGCNQWYTSHRLPVPSASLRGRYWGWCNISINKWTTGWKMSSPNPQTGGSGWCIEELRCHLDGPQQMGKMGRQEPQSSKTSTKTCL